MISGHLVHVVCEHVGASPDLSHKNRLTGPSEMFSCFQFSCCFSFPVEPLNGKGGAGGEKGSVCLRRVPEIGYVLYPTPAESLRAVDMGPRQRIPHLLDDAHLCEEPVRRAGRGTNRDTAKVCRGLSLSLSSSVSISITTACVEHVSVLHFAVSPTPPLSARLPARQPTACARRPFPSNGHDLKAAIVRTFDGLSYPIPSLVLGLW